MFDFNCGDVCTVVYGSTYVGDHRQRDEVEHNAANSTKSDTVKLRSAKNRRKLVHETRKQTFSVRELQNTHFHHVDSTIRCQS